MSRTSRDRRSGIIARQRRAGGANLIKVFIVLMLLAIVASLFSALVMLSRRGGDRKGIARALTLRVGLSIMLFLLLLAGLYFGIIPPQGLSPAPGR